MLKTLWKVWKLVFIILNRELWHLKCKDFNFTFTEFSTFLKKSGSVYTKCIYKARFDAKHSIALQASYESVFGQDGTAKKRTTRRFSTYPYNGPLDKELRLSQLFRFSSMWSVLHGAGPGRHNFLICQANGLSDVSLIFFLDFPIDSLFFNESSHP